MAEKNECKFGLPIEVEVMTEKQIFKEFIFNLEALPELWDSSAKAYRNKLKRSAAYEKLLQVLKKIKPTATADDVRKKINSLRSNYRKELKRIVHSKRSGAGEVYRPKSLTFKALQFLRKVENSVNEAADSEDEAIVKQNELIEKACLLLSKKPESPPSNINATAIYWSEKLEKLQPKQRSFAEKAINDILFEAQMGTLNRNSIQINQYSTEMATSPEPNDAHAISYERFVPVSSYSNIFASTSSPEYVFMSQSKEQGRKIYQ